MVSEALGPAAQPPFIPQQLLDTCADLDCQVSLSPVAHLRSLLFDFVYPSNRVLEKTWSIFISILLAVQ